MAHPCSSRFPNLHVDLAGPLPPSEGITYLFPVIDRCTRWQEAIPLPDAKTSTCVKALIRHWISRFGIPADITADRGAQFTSSLWAELGTTLGIHMQRTTAYHLQANGMVERLHRQLRSSLKARTTSPYWMDHLAMPTMILLRIRSAKREDPDCSEAELVYGSSLRLPGEFVEPTPLESQLSLTFLRDFQKSMQKALPPPVKHHNTTTSSYILVDLSSTGYVFTRVDGHRPPLQRPYNGPFRIISTTDKYFTFDVNGRSDTVTIDRLKPAYVGTNCTPKQLVVSPSNFNNPSEKLSFPSTTTRSGRTSRPTEHLNRHFVTAMS